MLCLRNLSVNMGWFWAGHPLPWRSPSSTHNTNLLFPGHSRYWLTRSERGGVKLIILILPKILGKLDLGMIIIFIVEVKVWDFLLGNSFN